MSLGRCEACFYKDIRNEIPTTKGVVLLEIQMLPSCWLDVNISFILPANQEGILDVKQTYFPSFLHGIAEQHAHGNLKCHWSITASRLISSQLVCRYYDWALSL